MKVHCGCGPCYLEGYINVDANPDYLATNAPKDILENNKTTIDKYYKHGFGTNKIVVADRKALVNHLPFKSGEVEEIVIYHMLEHIPMYELSKVLREINRVLPIGGVFLVAVPDIRETARLLSLSDTPEDEDWCIRLIHGTQKNIYSHHYNGFTERTLKKVLGEHGFGSFRLQPNINFYPAIHIKAIKERVL